MSAFKNHILINSLQRSGGSLLARLFDDHTSILSMPFELRYDHNKTIIPDFDNIEKQKKTKSYIESFLNYNFKKLDKLYFSKDLNYSSKINIDFKLFSKELYKTLNFNNTKVIDKIEQIIIFFFKSVFNKKKTSHFLNHLSMSCYSDLDTYIKSIPNIYFIQILRDPYTWYSSFKKHFNLRKNLDSEIMNYYLSFWHYSNIISLLSSYKFKQKYVAISYYDLVANTNRTMNNLIKVFNIKFEEIILTPTINGKKWISNSKIKKKFTVDFPSYDNPFKYLSDKEVEIIKNFLFKNYLSTDIEKYKDINDFMNNYKKLSIQNINYDNYSYSLNNINLILNQMSYKIINKFNKKIFNLIDV